MRSGLIIVGLALVGASCGGSAATTTVATTTPSTGGDAPTITAGTAAPATATTLPPPVSTTTSTQAAPTTVVAVELSAAVCWAYHDVLLAGNEPENEDALRRLSIGLGLPLPAEVAAAVDSLRGRSSALSEGGALAALDTYLLDSCGRAVGLSAGFDSVLLQGAVTAGPGGVRLWDGTSLVPSDPAGTYLAAFGDRGGGLISLLDLGGLKIVEYRERVGLASRDLLLSEDARLHGAAQVEGRAMAVMSVWEAGGEFGDLTQFLDLVPVDGSETIRVGVTGDFQGWAESVSYSDGRFLVTGSLLGGTSSIYLLGMDGAPVTAPGLPIQASGEDATPARLQSGRLAPDGETFAYLRVAPSTGLGSDGELRTSVVLQRVADGVEFMSIDIGGPEASFTSLDFDGHWVVVFGREEVISVNTWGEEGPEYSVSYLPLVESVALLDSGLYRGQ